MKVLFAVVALFAVALGEVDVLATANEEDSHHGPYSLKISLTNKDQEVFDDQTILEETTGRNFIADLISNVLEQFRDVIINEPLDPLEVDAIGPLDMNLSGVRVTASIINLRVEGFRWFVVDYVTFNPLRLTLETHLTLPWLIVNGEYDAKARLASLVLHNAGGDFRVFINRLEVCVDARLGTNLFGGHLILRDLDIRIDIADTHIQITGMTGSSVLNSLISFFVQNLTQEIIQNHLDDVSRILSEEIFDTINDFLRDFTLADILG